MLHCGVDWASDHHDVCIVDAEGSVRWRKRIGHDPEGIATLRVAIADIEPDPAQVAVADTGPSELRSQTQISRSRGEVRPEPPRPREEKRWSCVLPRSSRPTAPRAAPAAPSFIDATPVVAQTPPTSARRFDGGTIPRLSATSAGPSSSRAPPLA